MDVSSFITVFLELRRCWAQQRRNDCFSGHHRKAVERFSPDRNGVGESSVSRS
ncbi:uncharacterized protein PHALS_06593 [Plasmopara halstedii]|uniref:Uncharacterized protein n=1 Tax=Plasmopara halstedii TaxID=4781 RepID=A0A0P1B214_PLAHL|nr:uncharacterized protein PHALS_06593 [Plasmopara halstedii]CEG48792.1 hypothetical protein PHALS_06593 [Plasmopara halstedii]|eukprot:XP_024585161.1 hypothetical protein PHALS_06593 [Plasmopara halstedii]